MSETVHRTDDWPRLKGSGFVAIIDEPGVITVSRRAPGEKQARRLTWMWIAFSLLGFVGFVGLGGWGILLGGLSTTVISGLSFGLLARAARLTLQRFADRVIFTPETIYFLNGARQMGTLPREGMQQIVADTTGHGMRFHRFLSDVGYVSAFAGSSPSDHLIINNVLMAAFNQPIWLDNDAAIPQSLDFPAPELTLSCAE